MKSDIAISRKNNGLLNKTNTRKMILAVVKVLLIISPVTQFSHAKQTGINPAWKYVDTQKGVRSFVDSFSVKKSYKNKGNQTRYADATTIKRFHKPIQVHEGKEVYRFNEQVLVDCQDKVSRIYIRSYYTEKDDFIDIKPLVDNIHDMTLNKPMADSIDEKIMHTVCEVYSQK